MPSSAPVSRLEAGAAGSGSCARASAAKATTTATHDDRAIACLDPNNHREAMPLRMFMMESPRIRPIKGQSRFR